MVQLGEKIWFQHQDRTRAIPHIAKSGCVRGHSWVRQTLSDAWEPMNLEDWFGDPVAMVTRSHVTITEKIGKSSANDETRIEVDEEGHS